MSNNSYAIGFNDGYSKAKKEFLEFLETLFKSDVRGTPFQFFKLPVWDTKIVLVTKINELIHSLEGKK